MMASFSFWKACSLASSSSLLRTWDAHLMRSKSSGLMMRDSPEGSLAGTLTQGMNSQWGGGGSSQHRSALPSSLTTASVPSAAPHPDGPPGEKGSQARDGPNRDVLRTFAKRSGAYVALSVQPRGPVQCAQTRIPAPGWELTSWEPTRAAPAACAVAPRVQPVCWATRSSGTQTLLTARLAAQAAAQSWAQRQSSKRRWRPELQK